MHDEIVHYVRTDECRTPWQHFSGTCWREWLDGRVRGQEAAEDCAAATAVLLWEGERASELARWRAMARRLARWSTTTRAPPHDDGKYGSIYTQGRRFATEDLAMEAVLAEVEAELVEDGTITAPAAAAGNAGSCGRPEQEGGGSA